MRCGIAEQDVPAEEGGLGAEGVSIGAVADQNEADGRLDNVEK
jgi:hypothetical protein